MKTTETDGVESISYNISGTSALTKIRESEPESYTTELQTPVAPPSYEIRYHTGTASTSELPEEGAAEASGFDLRLTEEKGLLKITLGRTSLNKTNSEVARQQLENLFRGHEEVIFEDGMESQFSKALLNIIRRYGKAAIEVLFDFILHEKVNAELASEALRWLGNLKHDDTYTYRLWLLEQSLKCASARVRDGAALGLSFLGDPHAIPHLEEAVRREAVTELRQDLEEVLSELKDAL